MTISPPWARKRKTKAGSNPAFRHFAQTPEFAGRAGRRGPFLALCLYRVFRSIWPYTAQALRFPKTHATPPATLHTPPPPARFVSIPPAGLHSDTFTPQLFSHNSCAPLNRINPRIRRRQLPQTPPHPTSARTLCDQSPHAILPPHPSSRPLPAPDLTQNNFCGIMKGDTILYKRHTPLARSLSAPPRTPPYRTPAPIRVKKIFMV